MSDIKYGLISRVDSECIEATLNYIMSDFPNEFINVCEVGCYAGESGNAFSQYIKSKNFILLNTPSVRKSSLHTPWRLVPPNSSLWFRLSKNRIPHITGIDNNKDGEILRFTYDKLIVGNSSEVYNQLEDSSQHFIFIDGLHTFPQVVADFYSFQSKVKVGSYICFHDTGKHIDPLSGWQGVGDKNDSDMCLGGVRKALEKIGLLNNAKFNWRLIFDEADVTDSAGGVCIFKKIDKWD